MDGFFVGVVVGGWQLRELGACPVWSAWPVASLLRYVGFAWERRLFDT